MDQKDLSQHQFYMRKCIELAKIAKQRGDSPVGSILVKEDEIIGEGIEANKTQCDITYHAEIGAMHNVLLCNQTYKNRYRCSGIDNRRTRGFSSHFPLLTDNTISKWVKPPTLITGILEDECQKLHN